MPRTLWDGGWRSRKVGMCLAAATACVVVSCTKAQSESIALANRGVKAYQRGDVAEAATLFERAIEMYPKNQVAHYHLGLILLHERRDLEGAERALGEAARLNPRDVEVTFQLGRLAMEKGLLDEALARFEKVIEADSSHAGAYYWSGVVMARKGRLVEADTFYRKAVEADPYYTRAFNAMGLQYLEAGAESEAMAVFKEAIRLNPDDAEAHHNLGLVYLGMGNYEAASEEFVTALENDPDDITIAFNLANSLIRQGRYREAAFYLKKFIVEGSAKRSPLVEPAQVIYENLQYLIAEMDEAKASTAPK